MRKTCKASTFIPAPIEQVFDTFTDYKTYRLLSGVKSTRVLQAGQSEQSYSLGTIRELDLGFGVFHEQVMDVNYPHYWDYKFIKWPLSLSHIGGRMSFKSVKGGTQMTWESTIEMKGKVSFTLPLIAWISGYGLKLMSLQMKKIIVKKAK
ncbi:SRPBCC family protein [Acinetobacter sp. XS-4]|uniref:SRPBCC family protein n=1 Tax=Acinetobacter sp. XS-4 TaxID=2923375 RepID=UPI00208F2B78|nr:SRPBCC family protein [Acinetobacter sp. XS-4]USP42128.1 SRPBCC family protein [Acinetobacter sp. XS-4]